VATHLLPVPVHVEPEELGGDVGGEAEADGALGRVVGRIRVPAVTLPPVNAVVQLAVEGGESGAFTYVPGRDRVVVEAYRAPDQKYLQQLLEEVEALLLAACEDFG
jgi:hypothetical protein